MGITEVSIEKKRILVADDDPQVTRVLRDVIQQSVDCDIDTCSDGDTVLQKLAADPYDILVTDMLMPGFHGIELIRKVKEVSPDCDVLVMTAYPGDFPFLDAVRAGASDFMIKPYPVQEMTARLIRLFRERSERQIRSAQAPDTSSKKDLGQKYDLLFERNMNGMIVLSPQTLHILNANLALCELWGQSRESLIGTPITTWLSASDAERFTFAMQAIVGNKRGALADIRVRRTDGTDVWLDVNISYIDAEQDAFVLLVFSDVTEKRQTADRLAEMATTDELTGLLNYRTFYAWLSGAIETALINNTPVSLLFIDVDNFKKCNDTYGHQTGDALLRTIGKIVRQAVRTNDRAFRYGGDEFAVIVHGNASAAECAAERIRERFSQTENFGTSLSLGVAEYHSGMDTKTFVKTADEALYRAKASGKNAVFRASAV